MKVKTSRNSGWSFYFDNVLYYFIYEVCFLLLVAGHGQGDPGASGGGYTEAGTLRNLVRKIKLMSTTRT